MRQDKLWRLSRTSAHVLREFDPSDAFGNAIGNALGESLAEELVAASTGRPPQTLFGVPASRFGQAGDDIRIAPAKPSPDFVFAPELVPEAQTHGAELADHFAESVYPNIVSSVASGSQTGVQTASLVDGIGWFEKGAEAVKDFMTDNRPTGWWKRAQDWKVPSPEAPSEYVRLGDVEGDRHDGEMRALKDYLSNIPETLILNQTSMASVVKGFPEYFERHMELQIKASQAGVAKDTWFFGAGTASRMIEFVELGIDANSLGGSALDVGRLQAEQWQKSPMGSQLNGFAPGPQIFTKSFYESLFGRPVQGWDAIPAWQFRKSN